MLTCSERHDDPARVDLIAGRVTNGSFDGNSTIIFAGPQLKRTKARTRVGGSI